MFQIIYIHFVYNPLYRLYRSGPWSLGFWAGKSDSEICAILSHTDINIWINNNIHCEHMVQKHFESFEVCVVFLVYLICIYNAFICLIQYVVLWRHVHKYMECLCNKHSIKYI